MEELLKHVLPSVYSSWQHKRLLAHFEILKKQQAMHTIQVPSDQCVRLPRLLLWQLKRPNNAAHPSKRPERLYERRGKSAASAVKSRQEPIILERTQQLCLHVFYHLLPRVEDLAPAASNFQLPSPSSSSGPETAPLLQPLLQQAALAPARPTEPIAASP